MSLSENYNSLFLDTFVQFNIDREKGNHRDI